MYVVYSTLEAQHHGSYHSQSFFRASKLCSISLISDGHSHATTTCHVKAGTRLIAAKRSACVEKPLSPSDLAAC